MVSFKNRNISIGKIIGNVVFYAIIIAMISISLIMIKAKKEGKQPSIFGYKFYIVLTGSMTPTIYPGDLIIVKEVPTSEIKQGDIITFGSSMSSNITTHRVKDIEKGDKIKFITKGDANEVVDPNPVESKLVVGKVINHIDKIGTGMQFIQNNLYKIIITILVVGIVLAVIVNLGGKGKKAKKITEEKQIIEEN